MAVENPTFEAYFGSFLRVHQAPGRRVAVLLGSTLGITCAAVGVLGRRGALLLAAPFLITAPSWIAERTSGERLAVQGPPSFRILASLRLSSMVLAGAFGAAAAGGAESEPAADDDEPPHPAPNMVTDHTLH
ncbi:MAG TPA: hypothetical protein VHE30_22985 [Polyangiaceae bacterium]|nr:hypothetical protein [Polyangiaceae bacterium]